MRKGLLTVTALLLATFVNPNISLSAEKKNLNVKNFAVYYVDMQKIINESNKGKQAKSLIESKINQAKSKIEKMRKEIEKIKQELQSPVLSKQEKEKKEDLLQQKIRDLQRFQQDAQMEVANLERKYTTEIIKEVVKLIQNYRKEKNIPMIVEVREAGVIAADEKYDLTDRIIKLYNEQAGK
ncbi:periplasmic chaperone for outer membrane proteins Skp [Balnearium lithotrophicum]|uniref:Periplasmic chaperone for outer membrane proteins Skp n=1 Tax=Balnearium lithotrophicum TaxID=223788 RepID=A0A521BF08_9BACT|nr:OmpH family outer membrane protein [Balnearium lithotrophicum]SMO45687.1 periplasmic chaperone for outer membrane proteins Skp [Balnearium lithotrophicum]